MKHRRRAMTAPPARLAAAMAAMVATTSTRAVAAPQVRASASSSVVAPGETFVVTVESSDVESADQLGLDSTGKVSVLRTTRGAKSFSFSFGSGGAQQSVAHSIQTYLKAPSQGTLRFTPTARIQGKTLRGASIAIRVDEAAAKQRARSRDPFDDLFGNPTDPFAPGQDPFKGFRDMLPKNGSPGGIDDLLDREFGPPSTPELEMPAARAPYIFLHAVASKSQLVVGESLVVRNYMYIADGSQLRHYQPRYPVAPDFEMHALPHANDVPTVGRVVIAGVRYTVKSGGSFLLVPLKTGSLAVVGASAIIETGQNRSLDRSAETLSFSVTEPPATGRPKGYRLGDVGTFSVTTSAAPAVVESGGSVTVEVTTQGDGNFPAPWVFPAKPGVQWTPGQSSDQITYGEDASRKGTRITRYLATLTNTQAATVDINLGDVAWSSFEPRSEKYMEIPFHLGHVQVHGGAPASGIGTQASVTLPEFESRNVPYAAPTVLASKPFSLVWLGALAMPLLGLALRMLQERKHARKAAPAPTLRSDLQALQRAAHSEATEALIARIEALLARIEQESGELPASLRDARECVHLARYSGAHNAEPAIVQRALHVLRVWNESRP